MLSTRLLNKIEQNWERIAAAVVLAVHTNDQVQRYRLLDEDELRARARDIVTNLGLWLHAKDDVETGRRYEALGHMRYEQGYPLQEVIAQLHLIERKIADYVQDENAAQTAVDLYSEIEMIRALHRYFQVVQYSVVAGYEQAALHAGRWQAAKAS